MRGLLFVLEDKMEDEKIVYLVDGKIDTSGLREFCDGVCLKEFGRLAKDWDLGKDPAVMDKSVRNRLTRAFRKTKEGYYLTIRPQREVI